MATEDLLKRITANPEIYGGKPIIRGRRMAVQHVLQMMAAGDTADDLLAAYPWMEREDIQACLHFAALAVGRESADIVASTS